MKLEWLPAALEDRDVVYEYVRGENRTAALKIDMEVERQADRLVDFPYSGRPGRAHGTRELVITGTPCIAVYQVHEDAVLVLRVIHSAQDWPFD